MDPLFPPDPPRQLPHLELLRAEPTAPRRKQIPPPRPEIDQQVHGHAVQASIDAAVLRAQYLPIPAGVDPSLTLRIKTTREVEEVDWRRAGLHVVGTEANSVVILFSEDRELARLHQRVIAYEQPYPNKHPAYSSLIEAIDPEGVAIVSAEDRTGPLLRQLIQNDGIDAATSYRLDVELWDLGTEEARRDSLDELRSYIDSVQGNVTDSLVRDGMVLARVSIPGTVIPELLQIPSIASVDLPPRVAYLLQELRQRNINEVGAIIPPDPNAPTICVVDSGISRGHPLLGIAIGDTEAFPTQLGDGMDVNGHGTAVAGVALYGDVDAAWSRGALSPKFWIYGARVTNEHNEFDDDRLIPSQMIEAIEYFAAQGCRIFNISLGDERLPFRNGARPTLWSATLDNLANRLGVLIVVSAGNYFHHLRDDIEVRDCLDQYPHYLLCEESRIIEPATGANVLSVGALASEGSPIAEQRNPNDIPPHCIAQPLQPSPFTRSGLGLHGAVKPELVEVGGNYSYNHRLDRVSTDLGLGIITLNWKHETGQLFTVEHGTSIAAPRVSHMAAQILSVMPGSSSNLLRALLVSSASLPVDAESLQVSAKELRQLCGFGRPNLERACHSTDNRVVLVAEDDLPIDWLHVYEVPIPEAMRESNAIRHISVTLAFDPPVRRQRSEYLGNRLSFRLVRGLTTTEVVDAFKHTRRGEMRSTIPSRSKCNLKPGPRIREKGTIQHAVWTVSHRRTLDYPEPFHLIIQSKSEWQRPNDPPQSYAVVVTLEHSESDVRIYEDIQARARLRERTRVRV